jgi:hypothetical protein
VRKRTENLVLRTKELELERAKTQDLLKGKSALVSKEKALTLLIMLRSLCCKGNCRNCCCLETKLFG